MGRKLDFLIAGVQKGGTTALWHYLRQHPEIGLSERKELHFFDDETVDWRMPDYSSLHAHFASSNAKAIIGEATPIYTYWPPSLDRIQRYNPDIKIIFSLRDRVARAFSHWRMAAARNVERLSFSDAIRVGRSRVGADLDTPRRVYSYVERGFYAEQIERAYRLFPRANVLLIDQVNLRNSRAETLDHVCHFLGVAPFGRSVPPETVFSLDDGTSPSDADRNFLRGLFAADASHLCALAAVTLSTETFASTDVR